jgi:hypothetical protein
MADETIIDEGISPLYPDPLSRHFGMRVFSVDGVNFLDAPEEDIMIPQGDDQYVTVKTGEEFRLDKLALRAYGSPSLWHIIARANRIFNPFDELTAGMRLRIPSKRVVFEESNNV